MQKNLLLPVYLCLALLSVLPLLLRNEPCREILQDSLAVYRYLFSTGLGLMLGFWGWLYLSVTLLQQLRSPLAFLFYLFAFLFYLRECFELGSRLRADPPQAGSD